MGQLWSWARRFRCTVAPSSDCGFALPLPAYAAPTASAVHSSLSWFVGARVFYSGFTSHQVERVRLPIVVVNPP